MPDRFMLHKKPVVALVMDRYSSVIHRTVVDYAAQAGWALDATMAVASDRYPVPHANAILAVYVISDRTRDWLHAYGRIPVIHVWMSEKDIQLGWSGVAEDGTAVGRLVAEHFISLGFEHFAFYQRWRGPRSDLRKDAFLQTLKDKGYTGYNLISERRPKRADPINWLSDQLRKLPKPLALFVQDDLRGTESVYACQDAALSIPDDVAVIGVGNDELMTHSSGIPLSSVDIRVEHMAWQACEMLAQRLKRPTGKQQVDRIAPAGIVSRLSSDARAVASPIVARALRHIRDHLTQGLEPANVAVKLGCSRRWLDLEFTRTLGHPCAAEITRQRITRAIQLLQDTDDTVETVAAAVGMLNMPRFFRQFKNFTGLPPARYRLDKHSSSMKRDRPDIT